MGIKESLILKFYKQKILNEFHYKSIKISIQDSLNW